ncbi:DNA-3-methyladenine glycosylase I [Deltaproteobacteria bacterium Smac51]|nr:DNA-3-methyladenine glycosylase I [Deltaproteobacteria bacterium Smac51]
MEQQRCPWARSELEIAYHDKEWGRPERDDGKLFEMIILEGMQAGVSWSVILNKRENMRVAFDGFDVLKLARYEQVKEAELLSNPGILRNRAKVGALAKNAAAFLKVRDEFGSFSKYLWAFVDDRPIVNYWERPEDIPASTELSTALSRDLIKRGFKFVGPVICYAYMQAVGLVNDHLVSCPQHGICRDMEG